MPHVDEGLLHAWLDGAFEPGGAQAAEIEAHLAACADCRARLDEARALKERATLVLRHAAPPDVTVPPFEQVRARRRGGAARLPVRGHIWLPPNRLAWAATVVLALGAGWMANELARGGDDPLVEFRQEAVQTSAPAADRAPPAASPAAPEAGAEVIHGAQRGIARFGRTADESAGLADAAGADSRAAERERAGAPPPTSAVGAAVVADSMRADLRVRGVAAKTASAEAGNMDSATRRLMAPAAPAPPAPRLEVRVEGGLRVANAAELIAPEARARVDVPTLAAATRLLNDYFAASSANAWSAEPPGVARERLGQELATVPGAEQQSTELARVEDRNIARTLFRLDGGGLLELVQQSPAPAAQGARAETVSGFRDSAEQPASAIPLTQLGRTDPRFAGMAAVLAPRATGVLLLAGRIPPDSLAAIAARIR